MAGIKKFLKITSFLGTIMSSLHAADSQKEDALKKVETTILRYHHSHHRYQHQKFKEKKASAAEWDYRSNSYLQTMEKMEKQGIHYSTNYVADVAGNPVGGRAKGFCYAGSLGMFFNLDLDKMANLPGLDFYFTATWRKGSSLSANKIGNAFSVMQVYGSETLQLSNAALKATALNGNLEWYIGRISAGDIFLQSPYYSYFVNNGIDGNPIGIFFNVPFAAYPNSVWGTALDVKNKWVEIKVGAYNTNYAIFKSKYHGLNFTFKSPFGALLMTEVTLLVGQSSPSQYAGNYKLGIAYVTGRQAKTLGGESNGNVNYYFLADQVFFQDDVRRFGAFASFLFAPANIGTFPFFANGGLVLKGLIPKRADDNTSFGVVYGKYSKDIRQLNRQNAEPLQHAEIVLECNYDFYFYKTQSIQPSIQYVINPSGNKNIPNALVIATQVSLDF